MPTLFYNYAYGSNHGSLKTNSDKESLTRFITNQVKFYRCMSIGYLLLRNSFFSFLAQKSNELGEAH